MTANGVLEPGEIPDGSPVGAPTASAPRPRGERFDLSRLTDTKGARIETRRYGSSPDQHAQLWPAEGRGPHPVVVLLHGGYWRHRHDLRLMHAAAADLRRRGISVWNVEYRRIGSPRRQAWSDTFDDVAAATQALRGMTARHDLDLRRVALVGHSAGGQLALWLASRVGQQLALGDRPTVVPTTVVSLAGVCDLVGAAERHLSHDAVVELLDGTPAQVPERYRSASPLALLPLRTRQVIVHGTDDADVPFDIGQRYAEAAQAAGDSCEFVPLAGSGHFELIDSESREWRTVVDHLTDALDVR